MLLPDFGATPAKTMMGETVPVRFMQRAEDEALVKAREEALRGRDTVRGAEPLVSLWREVSKPRKGGAIAAQPPGCKVDFDFLFHMWLKERGLSGMLTRVEDQEGWAVFKYHPEQPVVESKPEWETAFHGTWWYAVWLILSSGVFLESTDRSLGHDFWEPGVYCSPCVDTGLWYARPQILFADGVYHRVIFELRVDPARRKRDRKRGGVQWVFPSAAVALHAVWVRSNAPPKNGEERVNGWDPELEALPFGCQALPPLINPRRLHEDPWPDMEDEFPFDKGNNNAPPWMQTAQPNPGEQPAKALIRPAFHAVSAVGGPIRPLVERMRGAAAAAAAAALPGPQWPPAQLRPASFWGKGARPRGPPGNPWADDWGGKGTLAGGGGFQDDSGWDSCSAWSSGPAWKDASGWEAQAAWKEPVWKGSAAAWQGSDPAAAWEETATMDRPMPVGLVATGQWHAEQNPQAGGRRWGGPIKPVASLKRPWPQENGGESQKKGRVVPPPNKAMKLAPVPPEEERPPAHGGEPDMHAWAAWVEKAPEETPAAGAMEWKL
mmetsp:Transcript_76378/g.224012  ORF Transcript_76378/g.224012 Transcript_76378/m.224012 type:complete len:549 (-) Transcript_76378:97-1743(-)